jgi:hypothetical protein
MLNFNHMKKLVLPLLLLLALACPSFAQEDGSTTGSADTAMAGEQQPAAASTPTDIKTTPEFKAVQSQVMGNPQILGDIGKLMDDPEIMAILSDPGFIAAVQSGNTVALGSDPRLKTLSENPKIQALIQRIKSQQ